MRVESLTVHGFGCLPEGRWELPADRAVLMIAANEAGKSTFAEAILAGLCGFPARKRSGPLKLSEVYRPWNRDAYSIELDLEAGGRRLRVLRDFDRNGFVVHDQETGREVSADYDSDLAQSVLGICRDDMLRIAFVSGKQVADFGSSPDLRARLSALVEGTQDGSGAEVAIAALQTAKVTLDGREIKVETALRRLSSDIENHRRLMRELDAEMAEAGEHADELKAARGRCSELRALAARLDSEYRAARLWEVRERISEIEQRKARIDTLRAEIRELEPYSSFPVDRADILRGAAERLRERSRQVEDIAGKLDRVLAEQADVRRRVEAQAGFATAKDEDAVALAGCGQQLEDAARALRDRELESQQALAAAGLEPVDAVSETSLREADRHLGRRAAVGWAIALAGAAGAAACGVLAAVGALEPVFGALGAAIGAALAIAGLGKRGRAEHDARRLRDISARLALVRETARSAEERAARLMESLGARRADGEDMARCVARTVESLSRYQQDRRQLRDLEREAASLSRELDERRAECEEDKALISQVLAEARIDSRQPLEDSLKQFAEGERRLRRYREAHDTLLPEALKQAAPDEGALDRLRAEEAELAAECPDSERPARSSSEVITELRLVRDKLDSAQKQVSELERAVGQRVDRYRREYPAARERIEELEAERDRIERFGAATARAAEALSEVARSSYRRWAAALNEQASSVLSRFNPAYTDLRFDDGLGFTVRRTDDGRILEQNEVNAYLSTGAKDQVYLAVRLACCLELSRSPEAIPIILDDPLTAADDDRFRSGMRFVVEDLARSNQVIVLSCHASRHDALRSEAWFEENVAILSL